jgi:hypothetical protein
MIYTLSIKMFQINLILLHPILIFLLINYNYITSSFYTIINLNADVIYNFIHNLNLNFPYILTKYFLLN